MPTYIEVSEGCIDEFLMQLILEDGHFFERDDLQVAFESAFLALMNAEGKVYEIHPSRHLVRS